MEGGRWHGALTLPFITVAATQQQQQQQRQGQEGQEGQEAPCYTWYWPLAHRMHPLTNAPIHG